MNYFLLARSATLELDIVIDYGCHGTPIILHVCIDVLKAFPVPKVAMAFVPSDQTYIKPRGKSLKAVTSILVLIFVAPGP